jgi:glutamyl-tRNA reductase
VGLTVLGVNHLTAPLEVRERFALPPSDVVPTLNRVLAAGASGGVVISTCNRTEFYLADPRDAAPSTVWGLLTDRLGDGRRADDFGYVRFNRDAVRHLYRVSSGLDSMVLGESQIQGQVRDAWEQARGQAGPVLHRLFQTALLVGARVRSETVLGAGNASAPSAAVAVAGKIFGDLKGRSALILGAGEVAELAATCLVAEGVHVSLVANRTYDRARVIAERMGARALTLEDAWTHFSNADVVICSTAAPHAVVTWERVAAAIERRRGRPLCILDLAVPRDVDPAVGQLENVFLYDIDDLQTVAAQAAARRQEEIPAAEQIVDEEVERFWAWLEGLGVVPAIKAFRGQMDTVREAELQRIMRRLPHLSEADRAQVEQFSHALMNKFLHQPTIALKRAAESGSSESLLLALRALFERESDE